VVRIQDDGLGFVVARKNRRSLHCAPASVEMTKGRGVMVRSRRFGDVGHPGGC
jgi:hypothetical protein